MSDDSFSTRLRNLSTDYYQNLVSFEEYRMRRKSLLEQIDEEFNGQVIQQSQQHEPEQPSIFMKTVAFFANTDLTEKDKDESE